MKEMPEVQKTALSQEERDAIYAKLQALADDEHEEDAGSMCGCHRC